MKRLLFLLVITLLMLPVIASAHTELASSNPAANQVIKEDLKEIVLTYEGNIESLSTMKLLKDGKEIPLENFAINGNQMKGTLSSYLENGSYTIQWSIAGEDSHIITGEIPFTVQKEEESDQQSTTEDSSTVQEDESSNEQTNTKQTDNQTDDSSSNMTMVTIVILVVLVIGLFLLFRRKR